MRNYRIAFFTVDWNYELVESTLHGLKKFVEDHENVQLCIFDCFGKDQDTARDKSEYAIFELADLSQFDGVMIQGNQIVLQRIREEITRRIAKVNIPAVSIDCPIEGCTMVGVDDRKPQYEVTEHIIRHHGARRLVYLTGIMDNGCPEARERMEGFLEACQANGIAPKDREVIQCTWRTSDGYQVAERWIAEGRALPDAFICANDEMALGLIEAFSKHGYQIPRDVRVTGFDNLTSAELSSPRLSTVGRNYARLNYFAMEVLLGKIDGTETRSTIPFDYEIVCSESCGCRETAQPGYVRNKFFQQVRFLKNFYTLQDQMAEDLFDASDLPELMGIIEKSHRIFGCDNVYVCVNDYYYDNYGKRHWSHDSGSFGNQMILAAHGTDDPAANRESLYCRFPAAALLPGDLMRDKRFLMFYPLHYNTYSIGYLAMDGISEVAKLNLHESIFSFLEIAIENVRKKGLLRQLNDELDNLYVHDALTGLYNRFGFERYGRQAFEQFLAEDGGAQILFVDMDDMKGINDQFGHEIGDAAICATAQILRDSCDSRDFLMRYGGDEFLVIASCLEDGLEQAIQRAASGSANSPEAPFRLGLSIGSIPADASRGRTLDEYIKDADVQMYAKKKSRKA